MIVRKGIDKNVLKSERVRIVKTLLFYFVPDMKKIEPKGQFLSSIKLKPFVTLLFGSQLFGEIGEILDKISSVSNEIGLKWLESIIHKRIGLLSGLSKHFTNYILVIHRQESRVTKGFRNG